MARGHATHVDIYILVVTNYRTRYRMHAARARIIKLLRKIAKVYGMSAYAWPSLVPRLPGYEAGLAKARDTRL